ncbi:stationary-phase-induced ribosome-associated protein [Kosakonia sp. MUSA4]|nr:stationary-phase-induced ribosome-associated protein [Kosakonia sp. MUSA4]QJT80750.1 30S ribosomal subunit S22 [Kosakonia sp. MUSA4]SEK97925.1 SSU ribosomal protein S22P [Kosakonia sacchari]
MKSNRQARHIMGLDYKVSNTRKIVNKDNHEETVVVHRSGRHRRAG